jgi:hypothetical protein
VAEDELVEERGHRGCDGVFTAGDANVAGVAGDIAGIGPGPGAGVVAVGLAGPAHASLTAHPATRDSTESQNTTSPMSWFSGVEL